jgi:hypothetical protein
MPEWRSTFNRMRGMAGCRQWMTWREFLARLDAAGVNMSGYYVRIALRSSPPSQEYGLNQYERRHVAMAIRYAQSRGLVRDTSREVVA